MTIPATDEADAPAILPPVQAMAVQIMAFALKHSKKSGPQFFVRFAPHTNGLDFTAYKNGFCKGTSGEDVLVYLDGQFAAEKLAEILAKMGQMVMASTLEAKV